MLEAARQAGADSIAVACPMCQANLDTRMKEAGERRGTKYNMPVVYFTQLMGLAFGYTPQAIGLNRLINSPKRILKKLGI